MRLRAKTDANQTEIVRALRLAGCSVWITSGFGKGAPDLVASTRTKTVLLEVKDGKKSPSKRRLTNDERSFHAAWLGPIAVVETAEEALEAVRN